MSSVARRPLARIDTKRAGEEEYMPVWVWRALKAARRVPWTKVWAAVIWLATVGRDYWDRLTPKERRELLDLMIKSKGSRSNLTNKEQGRLIELFNKIRRGGE